MTLPGVVLFIKGIIGLQLLLLAVQASTLLVRRALTGERFEAKSARSFLIWLPYQVAFFGAMLLTLVLLPGESGRGGGAAASRGPDTAFLRQGLVPTSTERPLPTRARVDTVVDTVYVGAAAPGGRPTFGRWLAAIFLIAAGIMFYVSKQSPQTAPVARKLSFGGVLLSIGTLIESEVTIAKFDLDHLVDLKIGRSSAIAFQRVGKPVGPFVPNQSTLADAGAAQNIDTIAGRLAVLEKKDKPAFILVLGGVDKRPLGGQALQHYGSNEGLALARAGWVAGVIKRKAEDLDSPIITLSAGSRHFGIQVPADSLADDRSVYVFVASRGKTH